MRIRVLFFGPVRDVVGCAQEETEVAAGSTLGSVFDGYAARFPALARLGASLLLSRNQEFATREDALEDGDEIAFLPPVSGGSAALTQEAVDTSTGNFVALTHTEIDPRTIQSRLLRGEDGAVVEFHGVTRNNTRGRQTRYLDYECYEPLALKELARLAREIFAEKQIGRIAIVHRLGRLLIGEASVVIVVTSPHRRAAFDAALEAIDRLKKTVPIWKKEYFADGEVWVEGDWDEALKATARAAAP